MIGKYSKSKAIKPNIFNYFFIIYDEQLIYLSKQLNPLPIQRFTERPVEF